MRFIAPYPETNGGWLVAVIEFDELPEAAQAKVKDREQELISSLLDPDKPEIPELQEDGEYRFPSAIIKANAKTDAVLSLTQDDLTDSQRAAILEKFPNMIVIQGSGYEPVYIPYRLGSLRLHKQIVGRTSSWICIWIIPYKFIRRVFNRTI